MRTQCGVSISLQNQLHLFSGDRGHVINTLVAQVCHLEIFKAIGRTQWDKTNSRVIYSEPWGEMVEREAKGWGPEWQAGHHSRQRWGTTEKGWGCQLNLETVGL